MIRKYLKVKSNSELVALRESAKALWLKTKTPLYRRIFLELDKPTRHMATVNVGKINKFANDGETVLVLGKVLGGYDISKKVNVVAIKFSSVAEEKIKNAKGKVIQLSDFLKKPVKSVKILR